MPHPAHGAQTLTSAPLAPDASLLPVQQVVEELSIPPLSDVGLVPSGSMTLYRSDTIRRDDTAQSLLQRLGVRDLFDAMIGAADFLPMLRAMGGRAE